MSSDNTVKKGSFFKAKNSFRADGAEKGTYVKIPKDSHIMVIRGGARIHFLAVSGKQVIDSMLSIESFVENCIESNAIPSLPEELLPYTLLKVKKFENGGFSCKVLENDTIIGDAVCHANAGTGIPKIEFEPLAACSHLLLQKIMTANKSKKYSLKKFIFYLYLNYQGFISFDDFCDI